MQQSSDRHMRICSLGFVSLGRRSICLRDRSEPAVQWVVRWIPYASRFPFLSSRAKRINIEARFTAQASTTLRHRKKNGKGLKSGEGFHPLAAEILVCCALISHGNPKVHQEALQSKTSSHADKKATTGKIADVPVPKTDERTVCRQECGPSCTLQIRGDQRCMRESTETTHGVLQLSVGGRRAM